MGQTEGHNVIIIGLSVFSFIMFLVILVYICCKICKEYFQLLKFKIINQQQTEHNNDENFDEPENKLFVIKL